MIEACIPRLCMMIRDIWFSPEFSVRENWPWNEAASVCYYSVAFTFVCVCVSQCLPAETINIFDMFVFVYDFLSEYVPQAHYLFTLQPQTHFLSAPVKNSQSTTVRHQKAGLSLLPPLISSPQLSLYSRPLSISPLAIYNAPSSSSVSSDSTSFPLHLIAPSPLSYPSSHPLCRACLISMLVHT